MSFVRHHEKPFPGIAATNIGALVPVKLDPSGQRKVAPVGSAGEAAFGVTGNSVASSGQGVTVHEQGAVVEAIAGASLGIGAELALGSTNGALVVAAGASGSAKHAVGVAMDPALPGETFSLYVRPRQISGLV
jgi:hypothetical protein